MITEKTHTVQTKEEANTLLKEHKTNTFVYALVADNDMVIVGEGTGGRMNVIFPGLKAPSHQKVAIAAFATLTSKDIQRIIIPTICKEESERIEEEYKKEYNFHEVSVYDKNLKYYYKRLNQLGVIENKIFTALLLPLLDSQGSDMGGFKKWIKTPIYTETFPGFKEYVSKIFGGYYSDL